MTPADEGSGEDTSSKPAGRFDGPAFAGPQARHDQVDALFPPSQRRKIWWQITIAGVLLVAASGGFIAYGVIKDDGASLGIAVVTVLAAAGCLYTSVFRRRDRRAR